MAWRGPALSKMAREPVVRNVIWMLKAEFDMSVFWFCIDDDVAICVTTKPVSIIKNKIYLVCFKTLSIITYFYCRDRLFVSLWSTSLRFRLCCPRH